MSNSKVEATFHPEGYVQVTHVNANVPESMKKGCEPDRGERAAMFLRFLNQISERRTVPTTVTTQESGDFLVNEVNDGNGWTAAYPPANEVVNGHRRGNGFLADKPVNIDERRHLESRRAGKGDPYNLPIRRVTAGPAEYAVVGFHRPTRRSDPLGSARRAMDKVLVGYSEQLHADGIEHILAGDANEGRRWARKFKHLRPAGQHGVDHVLVSRGIKVRGHAIHRLPRVSDHSFITVDLAVPITSSSKPLPKPQE